MANEITLLSKNEVRSILMMRDTMEALRVAFVDHYRKKTQMVRRNYLFPSKGRIGCMGALVESLQSAGYKIVSTFHENPTLCNLPSITALLVLNDVETGVPCAIMDATHITMMRTGAVSALATEYLGRKGSKLVGIVGAGEQGRGQLMGLTEVLKLSKAYVYDIDSARTKKFAEQMEKETGLDILSLDSIEEVVRKVDVLATATPSKTPVVFNKWVNPGLHINTVGGASRGEQEIDTEIFKRSKLVVDDFENASALGGITAPVSTGALSKEDVYAELGEIVAGEKPGRVRDDEVTVFVSSGLAIQDIATAHIVAKKAIELGLGVKVSLI